MVRRTPTEPVDMMQSTKDPHIRNGVGDGTVQLDVLTTNLTTTMPDPYHCVSLMCYAEQADDPGVWVGLPCDNPDTVVVPTSWSELPPNWRERCSRTLFGPDVTKIAFTVDSKVERLQRAALMGTSFRKIALPDSVVQLSDMSLAHNTQLYVGRCAAIPAISLFPGRKRDGLWRRWPRSQEVCMRVCVFGKGVRVIHLPSATCLLLGILHAPVSTHVALETRLIEPEIARLMTDSVGMVCYCFAGSTSRSGHT